jgi:hypothetical protein
MNRLLSFGSVITGQSSSWYVIDGFVITVASLADRLELLPFVVGYACELPAYDVYSDASFGCIVSLGPVVVWHVIGLVS